MNLPKILDKLRCSKNLTVAETTQVVEAIMRGDLETPQIEEFLILLRSKGETVAEIVAAAKVMRKHALRLSRAYPGSLDTCGTGGDAKNTLNISTLSAIVACAAGVAVAKHGNRSVSSVCGSADLLEALGAKIDLTPSQVESCLKKTGFGFFFAPVFHPSVRNAMQARRNITGKTIFNLLGPLTNPAGARRQLIGVYSASMVSRVADALKALGSTRYLVVHGAEGLDEISLSGPTVVKGSSSLRALGDEIRPSDFGLKNSALSDLQCHTQKESLEKARQVLSGRESAASHIVAANAAAALLVAGKSTDLARAFSLAQDTLRSKKAEKKMLEIVKVSGAFR